MSDSVKLDGSYEKREPSTGYVMVVFMFTAQAVLEIYLSRLIMFGFPLMQIRLLAFQNDTTKLIGDITS